MSSIKCPKCGMVNFASDVACKRCKDPIVPGVVDRPEPGSSKRTLVIICSSVLVAAVVVWVIAIASIPRRHVGNLLPIGPSAEPHPKLLMVPPGPYFHRGKVETSYDKFEDRTSLSLDIQLDQFPRNEFSTLQKLEMTAFVSSRGPELQKVPVVSFGFYATCYEWQFLRYRPLSLIVDGQRFTALELRHDGDVRSGYVTESMRTDVGLDEFFRLANGNKVEIRLGIEEFTLNKNQIDALRDFASRLKT